MFPISDSIKAGKFYFLNIFIIAFTAYIFIKQITAPDPEEFIRTYSLIPALVNFSDLSTLFPFVSAIFLHGGFLHIISNMWFLWVFGDNVEARVGIFLYPIIYLATGIIGNIAQYMLMPNSTIPMLGASGAVAGILGAYYIFFPHARVKTIVPIFFFFSVIEIPAAVMLGYWFVLQLISGAASLPFSGETGGIAFFAHIGGFISGMLMAGALR